MFSDKVSRIELFLLEVIYSCINIEQICLIEDWVFKVSDIHGLDSNLFQDMVDHKTNSLIGKEL